MSTSNQQPDNLPTIHVDNPEQSQAMAADSGKDVVEGAVPDFWGLPTRVRDVDEVKSPKDFKEVASRNWISDAAGVLSPEQTAEANRILTNLYRDLGVEAAIVTLNEVTSVSNPHSPRLRIWCVELFNHWGVGNSESNNGLMMVLLKDQRKLESVTGLGLEEVLSDDFLAEMQQAIMVPLLKNGLYGEALLAGVRECNVKIRKEAGGVEWLRPPAQKALESGGADSTPSLPELICYTGGKAVRPVIGQRQEESSESRQQRQGSGGGDERKGSRMPFLLAGGLTGFGLMQALSNSGRKKKCKKCRGELRDMTRAQVAEMEPDACTLMEKELNSARYLHCPTCTEQAQWGPGGTLDQPARPDVVKVPSGGRFDLCPKCNCICLERREHDVRSATFDMEGVRTVTRSCRRCNFSDGRSESIPRLRQTNDDKSGSTYGGGASGGGGASSSF